MRLAAIIFLLGVPGCFGKHFRVHDRGDAAMQDGLAGEAGLGHPVIKVDLVQLCPEGLIIVEGIPVPHRLLE